MDDRPEKSDSVEKGQAEMNNAIDREEWLAKRQNYLGASEIAAVLGQSPHAGPLDVYADKVHGKSFKGNRDTQRGKAMEPLIADWYEEETGRKLINPGEFEFMIHPSIPFLGATLDRVVEVDERLEKGPLEIKSVGGFVSAGEWEIEPPLHFQIQLQTQMAVYGSSWGALCGGFMATNAIKHFDIDFNPEFWNAAVPLLEEFMDRVKRRSPPPADGSPHALETVKRVWSSAIEGKIVAMPTETIVLIEQWKDEKGKESMHKACADEIETRLRDLMKDAEIGALPNGQFLTLKETIRKGYTVSDSSFRTLRVVKKLK